MRRRSRKSSRRTEHPLAGHRHLGFSLPNLISALRLVAVPVIVSLMLGQDYALAAMLFFIAGVSDAVDGFIAKRFGMTTALGAYLDPIADKALLVCVFVTLGVQGQLAQSLVVLVVARDLLIVGAVMLSYFLDHPLKIAPLVISKINTAAQILLAGAVLTLLAFVPEQRAYARYGEWLVAATTILSGLAYFIAWFNSIAAWDRSRGTGAP